MEGEAVQRFKYSDLLRFPLVCRQNPKMDNFKTQCASPNHLGLEKYTLPLKPNRGSKSDSLG